METPKRTTGKENESLNQEQLNIPASPFLKKLGFGTGVNVYKLNRSPRSGQQQSPWALKKVSRIKCKNATNPKVIESRLKQEAEILRKLEHPNIVGYRTHSSHKEKPFLAMEYCQKSLGDILEDRYSNEIPPLPANLGLKVASDIAKGLEYLHFYAKLLHGDIKSYNVLIKGDFEICKLCDFGVSLQLDDSGNVITKSEDYIGTELWSAPEVIQNADLITSKADIFSYGLVIYEILTQIPPHTLNMDESTEPSVGTRPAFPDDFSFAKEYVKLIELFYICTVQDPNKRPSAQQLVNAL